MVVRGNYADPSYSYELSSSYESSNPPMMTALSTMSTASSSSSSGTPSPSSSSSSSSSNASECKEDLMHYFERYKAAQGGAFAALAPATTGMNPPSMASLVASCQYVNNSNGNRSSGTKQQQQQQQRTLLDVLEMTQDILSCHGPPIEQQSRNDSSRRLSCGNTQGRHDDATTSERNECCCDHDEEGNEETGIEFDENATLQRVYDLYRV